MAGNIFKIKVKVGQQVKDETDESAVTPRFTLNYQATDDIMLYTLVAKGNKPAEFNTGYFRITACLLKA